MNPSANRLNWIYQKNKHLIDSLVLHKAPKFTYSPLPGSTKGEIPVFTFHSVSPDWFEAQARHLAENDYKTLTVDEFKFRMSRPGSDDEKCVLLTFDDGMKQVWSVAYPILKKYGLNAVCFLIPGCMQDHDSSIRENLENVWNGEALTKDVMGIGPDENPLITWMEAKAMQDDGIVEFESHTLFHSLVPVEDEIVEFVRPGFDPHFYGNSHVPMYTENGVEQVDRTPLLGMPIYKSMPRMQAPRRFYDNEAIRHHCVEFVEKHGGREFFNEADWEAELNRQVASIRSFAQTGSTSLETNEQRDAALFEELGQSREIIENKLGIDRVTQLCYPWYDACDAAIAMSRKAGFEVNFFGQRSARYTNRPGDDLMGNVRVDEVFLQRLPGKARHTLLHTLKLLIELRGLPQQIFPEGRPRV